MAKTARKPRKKTVAEETEELAPVEETVVEEPGASAEQPEPEQPHDGPPSLLDGMTEEEIQRADEAITGATAVLKGIKPLNRRSSEADPFRSRVRRNG